MPIETKKRVVTQGTEMEDKRKMNNKSRTVLAANQQKRGEPIPRKRLTRTKHAVTTVAVRKVSVPRPVLVPKCVNSKKNDESKLRPTRVINRVPRRTATISGVPKQTKPTAAIQRQPVNKDTKPIRIDVPDLVSDIQRKALVPKSCMPSVVATTSGPNQLEPLPTTPRKPASYVNLDKGRKNEPQLCQEYAKDIYDSLLQTERKDIYHISQDFLQSECVMYVKGRHRAILVDWLFLIQLKHHLLTETMYLCVDILDRVLQFEPSIPKNKLQLVGITALYMASKYEEIYPPSLMEFVYLTAETYTTEEVRAKELEILKGLDYQFNRPFCITFLRRYSMVLSTTPSIHNLAKYVMELSLLNETCAHLLPSKRAAGALLLALSITSPYKPPSRLWDAKMAYHTKYGLKDIHDTKLKLKIALKNGHNNTNLSAIRKKFEATPVFRNGTILSTLNRL